MLTFPTAAAAATLPATRRRWSGAREVLLRYGARILEEEGAQVVALFGLGDADGRDTESAVRAALVILRSRGGAQLRPASTPRASSSTCRASP